MSNDASITRKWELLQTYYIVMWLMCMDPHQILPKEGERDRESKHIIRWIDLLTIVRSSEDENEGFCFLLPSFKWKLLSSPLSMLDSFPLWYPTTQIKALPINALPNLPKKKI